MMDTGKKYYITDTEGHYYRLDEKNSLVVAANSSDAALFTIQEVKSRIGIGRRSRFYRVLEACAIQMSMEAKALEPAVAYDASELNVFETPTMYDSLHNDWETMLTNLCYMSNHMNEYQKNLRKMLSDVDKEICDIMHYLELSELSDGEMLKASKMLQERRRRRREIKDEMYRTALMCSTFLDRAFGTKIQHSLEVMEKMKERQYTPRKLSELFTQQQGVSA